MHSHCLPQLIRSTTRMKRAWAPRRWRRMSWRFSLWERSRSCRRTLPPIAKHNQNPYATQSHSIKICSTLSARSITRWKPWSNDWPTKSMIEMQYLNELKTRLTGFRAVNSKWSRPAMGSRVTRVIQSSIVRGRRVRAGNQEFHHLKCPKSKSIPVESKDRNQEAARNN